MSQTSFQFGGVVQWTKSDKRSKIQLSSQWSIPANYTCQTKGLNARWLPLKLVEENLCPRGRVSPSVTLLDMLVRAESAEARHSDDPELLWVVSGCILWQVASRSNGEFTELLTDKESPAEPPPKQPIVNP